MRGQLLFLAGVFLIIVSLSPAPLMTAIAVGVIAAAIVMQRHAH